MLGRNATAPELAMAGNGKFEDLHLDDLSLEPLPDPHLMNYTPPKTAAEKQAAFKLENRNKKVGDRRINPDRRKVPRFEANRRSGKERRPEVWDPAIKNTT